MRVICAGDTGLIKIVEPETSKILSTWGEQSKDNCINSMCWAKPNSEGEFVIARKNKSIETYFPTTGDKRYSFKSNFEPKSIHSFETKEKRKILVASPDGNIELNTLKLKDDSKKLKQTSFKAQGPIDCMRVFHHQNDSKIEYGIGGKENLIKIYDLETQKITFKTKNVKHDFLDMRQPLAVSDLCFMDENLIAYCTLYHQIRLHDRRQGPKPIMQKAYGEFGFTRIIPSPLSPLNEVICGALNGQIIKLNWKDVNKKIIGAYKGSPGSVRDFSLHPSLSYFSSTGADRFVRIFDLESKKLLYSSYVVQKQNAILFTSDKENKENSDEESENSEEENEQYSEGEEKQDVWDDLENIEEEQKKKKRKLK
eukprot:gene11518-4682_t